MDELRHREPEETLEEDGGEELRGPNENDEDAVKRDDISSYYEFESTSSKHVKKFKATATDYRLRLKNLGRHVRNRRPAAALRHHRRRAGTPQRTAFDREIW